MPIEIDKRQDSATIVPNALGIFFRAFFAPLLLLEQVGGDKKN